MEEEIQQLAHEHAILCGNTGTMDYELAYESFKSGYRERMQDEPKFTKRDFLKAAKLGEVSIIDAKHVISLLDEVIKQNETTINVNIQCDLCVGNVSQYDKFTEEENCENCGWS